MYIFSRGSSPHHIFHKPRMKYHLSSQMLWIAVVVLVTAVLHRTTGRDLRQVSEPKIPASCVSLTGNGGDETSTIQKALHSCAKGRTVRLASGTFVSGPLTIPSGVGLWIDSGAILKASTNAKLYDKGKNLCGTVNIEYRGCNSFISMQNAVGSGIYGKGTIDGQGGVKLVGKSQSWWDLSHEAQVQKKNENNPFLIEIQNSRDITLYQITIKNGPNFQVIVGRTDGFTAWGVTIDTPPSARNTDGIDPASSHNVTIAHCSISTGDDNVAIKASSGAPSSHMSIINNHFGRGHGMSIGSDINNGVSDVTVTSLTLRNTDNGLRIKSDRSRGGLVTDVTYTDVCMQGVKNPIILDTAYSKTASGNLIPVFKKITFNNIRVLTKGTFTFDGFSDAQPIEVNLNNVHIKKGSKWAASHAHINGKYAEDENANSC
uniref:Glycoside hydrolase family 28 n=1 Tax=Peruphasma schultei TaxID=614134 RepID=A0A191XT21_9NEOP|nr:glycoside hydrolase family 28 [Peruphasma schultei]